MTTLALAARQRSPTLPDVPTTGEFGFPKLLAENWYCAVAPRGLPAPVAARFSAALKEASQAPGVKNELAAQGAEAAWTSPEEMLALMRKDSESWRQRGRDLGGEVGVARLRWFAPQRAGKRSGPGG